jgi:transposase
VAVHAGASQRSVAVRFGVGLGTVQRALARARGRAVEDVDWADRSTAPHHTRRTDARIEALVLETRRELADGVLGEAGAVAIRETLIERGETGVPAVRTIGRILERHGVLDGRRRIRRPAPPAGWYLPEVADHRAELDSFDAIVGLRLFGGAHIEVLTGVSLHGGLVGAWPTRAVISPFVVDRLIGHWQEVGLPGFAQFDNDTRFLGTHGWPDILGRVPRVCLALGITPVFAPIGEQGFQAAIEGFNGLWQARVWKRSWLSDEAGLEDLSDRYVEAHRARRASRIESAPTRRPFPATMPASRPGPPSGRLIFIRRTTIAGRADVLGRSYFVDRTWPHRLVRAELDLDALVIRFHALRRRDPADQPLLAEVAYRLPERRAWVAHTY